MGRHEAEQDLDSLEDWEIIEPQYQHQINMEIHRNDIHEAETRRQAHRMEETWRKQIPSMTQQ